MAAAVEDALEERLRLGAGGLGSQRLQETKSANEMRKEIKNHTKEDCWNSGIGGRSRLPEGSLFRDSVLESPAP